MRGLRAPVAVRRASCACFAVLCALGPARARAQHAIQLEGAECPAATPLVDRVRELLGPDVEIPAGFGARVAIDGERLRVELSDGAVRELRGESCDALLDAAAIIVAVAIDPSALERAMPPDRTPPPTHAGLSLAAPTDPPPPRAIPPSTPDATEPVRFGGSARALVASGLLPEPIPAIALDVHALFAEIFVLRLGFSYHPPSRGTLAGDSTRGAEIDLLAFAIEACARIASAVEIDLCASGEAGAMRASGFGVTHPQNAEVPWGAAGVAARGALVLVGPLRLIATAALLVPIDRPRFVLDGIGAVFDTDVVSVRGSLGIGAQFP
jgi:hypothetical protein